MKNKPKIYQLTQKGISDKLNQSTSFIEEMKIIEILMKSPNTIRQVQIILSKEFNIKRSWEYIESTLEKLREKKLVEKRK